MPWFYFPSSFFPSFLLLSLSFSLSIYYLFPFSFFLLSFPLSFIFFFYFHYFLPKDFLPTDLRWSFTVRVPLPGLKTDLVVLKLCKSLSFTTYTYLFPTCVVRTSPSFDPWGQPMGLPSRPMTGTCPGPLPHLLPWPPDGWERYLETIGPRSLIHLYSEVVHTSLETRILSKIPWVGIHGRGSRGVEGDSLKPWSIIYLTFFVPTEGTSQPHVDRISGWMDGRRGSEDEPVRRSCTCVTSGVMGHDYETR